MKTYRDLSMPSLNQFGAVGIGATPSRRHFRKGRCSPSGALRTAGIIAVALVLACFNRLPEAEAATVCEVSLASVLAGSQQCETEVPGTVEQVTMSYQELGYRRVSVLPGLGDVLAEYLCELLTDSDFDDDPDFSNVLLTTICASLEPAGVTISTRELAVVEGESGAYTVVLDANPDPFQDGLTVTPTPPSNNADVTFAPATLAFTSANWKVSQTVTVTAAHDDDAADESVTVTHAVSGYGNVTAAAVTVNVVDDDQAANAPSRPRNLRATPGDGEVTLTWSPPLSDGGSPNYSSSV